MHVCVCVLIYNNLVYKPLNFSIQLLVLVSVRRLYLVTMLHLHALVSEILMSCCILGCLAWAVWCMHVHIATQLSAVMFVSDSQSSLSELLLLKTADGKKIKIISELAPSWRDVGYLMNFDLRGKEIETIDQKHHGDPKNCCRAMFQHWLDGNGVTPYSWRTLIGLLDDLDQEVLAREIQSALSASAK